MLLLINTSRIVIQVPIVKANGNTDTVSVQPGARLKLAAEHRLPLDYRAPGGLIVSKQVAPESSSSSSPAAGAGAGDEKVSSTTPNIPMSAKQGAR